MTTKKSNHAPADTIPALISNSKLQKMYDTMLACRILEAHTKTLGGAKFSAKGKEAAIVGAAIDLTAEDRVVTSLNPASVGYARGARLAPLLQALHQRSADKKSARSTSVLSAASQIGIATGIALAHRAEKPEAIAAVFFSGESSEDTSWQAALAFAYSRKLPLLCIAGAGVLGGVETVSTPYPVIPVDGNDVVAVYRVAFECIQRLRRGNGPSVIVCKDFPREIDARRSQDPLRNMEQYLLAKKLFNSDNKHKLIHRFEKEVERVLSSARKIKKTTTPSGVDDVVFLG